MPDVAPMPAPNAPDAAAPAATVAPPAEPTPDAAPPMMQDQAQPAAPPPPGSFFKHLSHSFAGAVLGALSGDQKVSYEVDDDQHSPNYGKTIKKTVPATTGDKIREIARNALVGLAAGSQTQGPSALGALGVGAVAAQNAVAQQDQQKKNEAQKDFELQQKTLMDKAQRAHYVSLTYSNTMDALQKGNEMNFKGNKAIADAYMANPAIGGEVISQNEAKQKIAADPHFLLRLMPIGQVPLTAPDGQAITSADGTPSLGMQFYVRPETVTGKTPLPAAIVQEIKDYNGAGITNWKKLTEGTELTDQQITSVLSAIQDVKKKETAGWEAPKTAYKDGKPVAFNPAAPEGKQYRDYPAGVSPASPKDVAETRKLEAEAKAKEQEAVNLKQFGISIPPTYTPAPTADKMSMEDLQKDLMSKGVTVPPSFGTLYAVAHYDSPLSTFPSRKVKGSEQLDQQTANDFIRRLINPSYDVKNYEAVKNMEKEFDSTKNNTAGGSLIAFNTATAHLGQLIQAGMALKNGDIKTLNRIAQAYNIETNQPAPLVFNAIRDALAGELGKSFKGAAADVPEREAIVQNISNAQNPDTVIQVASANAHLMLSKAHALASHYFMLTGKYPKNLMTPEAKAVYDQLGIDTSLPGAPSAPSATSQNQIPPDAKSRIKKGDQVIGYRDKDGKAVLFGAGAQ